ncbi:MAG: NAD-dependent epimerase/dehydratase family protein [Candidatus Heimdallarchaeota archaeon]
MQILVTGGTGFLGSYVVQLLVEQNHDVVCLVRGSSDTSFLDRLGVDTQIGDLGDPSSLHSIPRGTEIVHHIGAYYTFLGKKKLYQKYNVEGTRALLDACEAAGVTQFIYCSSAEVTVDTLAAQTRNDYITEETPYNPQFEYGHSKMKAEKIVKQHEGEMRWTILRPSGMYGPHNIDDISFWFIEAVAKHKLSVWFRVRNTGTIHFTHVRDVAQGFILAQKEAAYQQIFYLASDECKRVDEILELVGELLEKKTPRLTVPKILAKMLVFPVQLFNKARGKPDFFLQLAAIDAITRGRNYSNQKAKNLLGFQPQYDYVTGITETINWYKEEGIL